MLYIVVGPDKAGKTSLIKDLRKYYGWQSTKFSKDDATVERVYSALDSMSHLSKDIPYVFDRFPYPDDFVYSKVLEHKDSILVSHRKEIERKLSHIGATLVFVFASRDTIERRYQIEGGDEYTPLAAIEPLIRGYFNFIFSTFLPVIVVDTTAMSVEQSVEYFRKEAQVRGLVL